MAGGTGGRKAPSDPGFHPSRDATHHRGDETSTGQQVFLDQGEIPSRLEMFGAQGKGDAPASNSSRLRPNNPESGRLVKELGHTKIPTQHFAGRTARNRIDVEAKHRSELGGAGGYYRPSKGPYSDPLIASDTGTHSDVTMVHELGHAHHYDTVGRPGRDHLTRSYRDARGYAPDPLKEAVADAYVDRYGGRLSAAKTAGDFSHISSQQHGYGSEYEVERGATSVWNSTDRAIYAGTRAHFSETGDIPQYQSRLNPQAVERGQYLRSGVQEQHVTDPISDATIHHLSKSPHARAAWDQTTTTALRVPLSQVAAEASRRHQDRRLLNEGQFTQTSMFDEMQSDAGEHKGFMVKPELHTGGYAAGMEGMKAFDTETELAWPKTLEHNQFGEAPRKAADIQNTLGLSKSDVKQYAEPTVKHVPDVRENTYRSDRKDL